MNIVPYAYRILHRPASHARVMLNGLPLYDRTPDANISPSGPISHGLVPGENKVWIQLVETPPSPKTPLMGPHFAFQIHKVEDEAVLWSWEYPKSVAAVGEIPKLPWMHAGVFVPEGEVPEPTWARATPEDFPPEGTPEQHAAVADLWQAFANKDAGRFSDAMDLKFGDFEKYYGARPGARSAAASRLGEPWELEPLAPEDLRFDRYLDGRVAFVRRESGRKAVRAVNRDEPMFGWGADFFMTRVDGRWRIFR